MSPAATVVSRQQQAPVVPVQETDGAFAHGTPSPELVAAIDAARDLAWRPTSNLPGSVGYHERKEASERVRSLVGGARLPAEPSDELRYLFAAMVRVCVASFANRRGHAYYERKRLVYELRGCLDVYDRSRV